MGYIHTVLTDYTSFEVTTKDGEITEIKSNVEYVRIVDVPFAFYNLAVKLKGMEAEITLSEKYNTLNHASKAALKIAASVKLGDKPIIKYDDKLVTLDKLSLSPAVGLTWGDEPAPIGALSVYVANVLAKLPTSETSGKVNGSHFLALMLERYYSSVESVEGVTYKFRNSVTYVNIVLNPSDRYMLSVRLDDEKKDILLKEEYSTFEEAVAEAVVLSAKHANGVPADVRYEINSCKLSKLWYDEESGATLWGGVLAPLVAIVAELNVKLKDGL